MNDLAALLGGGGAAAPLPAGPMGAPAPGGDDAAALAAMLGGGLPPDPMAGPMPVGPGVAPAGPMYPSTDPAFMSAMLQQIVDARAADHAALEQDQVEALVANPMFEALMGGAPVGPGAGQDMQGIAPMGDIAPEML